MGKLKFTKQEFIDTIKAIKSQCDYDQKKAELLSDIYNADVMPNDNSRLTNQLFKLLQAQFKPLDGKCRIQEFCYDFNFGEELKPKYTIEELWEDLKKTHE